VILKAGVKMAFGKTGSFLQIVAFSAALNNKLTVIENLYLAADWMSISVIASES
jgi:hypothetical protein